uniref:Tectonic-1-3 N-terminal domain-containing protein n=1 Tax=Timema poppense TaxID=170557 RepID=A0A7R9CI61_TIMPO|nr:unnamed protein product [Timema poppensis]
MCDSGQIVKDAKQLTFSGVSYIFTLKGDVAPLVQNVVTRLYQHLRLQLLNGEADMGQPFSDKSRRPVGDISQAACIKMWCKTNQQLAKPVTHPGRRGEGEEKWGSYHLRTLNKGSPYDGFLCVVCDFPIHPINWSLATVKGSSSRERAYFHPAYSEVASSPCDLTENFCDVSCCSDQDCSEDQKSSFTCSIKKQNEFIDQDEDISPCDALPEDLKLTQIIEQDDICHNVLVSTSYEFTWSKGEIHNLHAVYILANIPLSPASFINSKYGINIDELGGNSSSHFRQNVDYLNGDIENVHTYVTQHFSVKFTHVRLVDTDMGNITEEEILPVSFSGNPGYEVSRPLVVVMNNSLENNTFTVWKQGMVGVWSKGGICMIRPESLPESYSVHHTAVPFIIPSGVIGDFVVAIDVSFFVTVVEDCVRKRFVQEEKHVD